MLSSSSQLIADYKLERFVYLKHIDRRVILANIYIQTNGVKLSASILSHLVSNWTTCLRMNLESDYYLVKPTLIWMKITDYSFPKHVLYSYTISAIFVQSTLKHFFLNILQHIFIQFLIYVYLL